MLGNYTPDWTQYGITFDQHIDRIEESQDPSKCSICYESFEYDELEDGKCYECREEAEDVA